MENEKGNKNFDTIVYSAKVKAGKRRTYFLDVRQTRGSDYFLSITESTKRPNSDSYDRHKIFVYKEDFNRFADELQNAIDYIKTNLMPDYDYDEFKRRNEEYEARAKELNSNSDQAATEEKPKSEIEDDLTW